MSMTNRLFESLYLDNSTAVTANHSTEFAMGVAGKYTTVNPTLTDGKWSFLRLTSDGKLYVQNSSDIELGSVELKDGDTDNRANVKAADTARTTATLVLATQHIGANGSALPSGTSSDPVYVKDTASGTDVVVVTATGAAAINTTTTIAAEFKLLKVLCHFSSAPTTSENFVITLDSNAGAAYDTAFKSVNPSLSAGTDIVYLPEGEAKFVSGDEIKVTFTNTDTITYGLSIYYQLI